jgi:hypothetical protein
MRVDRGIGLALQVLVNLVDGFVLLIVIGDRIFAALLEIDDERYRDSRTTGPARIGR